jgi:Na+/melibiose symporter-like transporter
LKDAVANPKYRKATWVNIGYIIFHELTGINVIMLYSTEIFKQMKNSEGENTIKPRTGTILVGFIDVVGAAMAFALVKRFGRRTLLIYGHIGIAICHALVGYFNNQSNDIAVLFSILMFIIIY